MFFSTSRSPISSALMQRFRFRLFSTRAGNYLALTPADENALDSEEDNSGLFQTGCPGSGTGCSTG